MGREGPCHHCRIMYTPLWRAGPAEKPVLCNACGSRWRLRGSLNGYVPKHGIRDASGNIRKLPPNKHAVKVTSQQKLRAGKVPEGSDLRPTSLKEENFGISSSGSSIPSPEKCMPTQGTEVDSAEAAQWPVWYPENVTRRKRSNLQQPSSLIDTLHLQLRQVQRGLEDKNKYGHEEEDILIYNKWQYIPDSEIGVGPMLHKPPTAP